MVLPPPIILCTLGVVNCVIGHTVKMDILSGFFRGAGNEWAENLWDKGSTHFLIDVDD